MNRFFHWCSRGLTADLLFASEQEFIAGMNRIAVCYLYCLEKGHPVRIVAFCLLNNHFHFVLYGKEEDTAMFMEHYKMLTLQWIRNHRSEKLHESLELGSWPARNPEHAREKVIYTLRQTLEAGLRITPQGYPWCSARLMFNDNSYLLSTARKGNELTGRYILKAVNSKITPPESWKFMQDGMIWPGDYTDIGIAEGMFSGVKDFMFCMNNGNIDKAVLAEISAQAPSLPDVEVKDKAESLARDLFAKKRISECSAEERVAIARFLRHELHCGHKQLARIVRMDEVELRRTI